MANIKEISDRMSGIKDTMKITNAMYLIASSKLQKARKNMEQVQDYFQTIDSTIDDILSHMPDMEHIYLESISNKPVASARKAYILITADKGLAGAYNLNVIKKLEKELADNPGAKIFVAGQVGRQFFQKKQANMDTEFLYSSQHPSLQRARSMTVEILDQFHADRIDEVYIIFTQMKNVLHSETVMLKLLPLSRKQFCKSGNAAGGQESFFPDPVSVFNQIAPITMHGIIFSALTESYCVELNDRMMAMDSASKNAAEMLRNLQLNYNRTRQGNITQEITEVIAGSRAQKKRKMS